MLNIKIKNTTYKLSDGKTSDILDLAEWAKKQDPKDIKASFIAIAQSIVIGLRATYFNLRWYQLINKLRYKRFLKDYAVQYVLENTNHTELLKVNQENSKKKVVEKGKL